MERAYYDFFHDHQRVDDANRYVVVPFEEMGSTVRIVGQEQDRIEVASCIAEVVIGMQVHVVELAMPRSVVAKHIVQLEIRRILHQDEGFTH